MSKKQQNILVAALEKFKKEAEKRVEAARQSGCEEPYWEGYIAAMNTIEKSIEVVKGVRS